MFGPQKSLCVGSFAAYSLLAARVLRHGLCTLADGVFGQLSRKKETHSGLDLPRGERRTPVIVSKARRFGSNAFEYVIHERVHDRHCFAANAGVGMHLLQHFVDVDRVAFPPPLPALLVTTALGLRLGRGFLRSFARCCFGRHFDSI